MKLLEETAQFIANAAGADKLRTFRPSLKSEQRVAKLLARQHAGLLKASEHEELELFVLVDQIMSLAKAWARN
jgi:hypothetical protein